MRVEPGQRAVHVQLREQPREALRDGLALVQGPELARGEQERQPHGAGGILGQERAQQLAKPQRLECRQVEGGMEGEGMPDPAQIGVQGRDIEPCLVQAGGEDGHEGLGVFALQPA